MANPTFPELLGVSHNDNDAGTLLLNKTKADAPEALKEILDNVLAATDAIDPPLANTLISKLETFGDVVTTTYTITFLSTPIVGGVIDEV